MFFKLIQGLITTSCRFIKMTNYELHNVNDERERISKLQNLEERESGCGGENQTEGTTTEREISRKRSLEILSPNWP